MTNTAHLRESAWMMRRPPPPAPAPPDTCAPSDPPVLTFERFFEEAWTEGYRLACFLTQNPAAAEDIVQEAMSKMYTTWGQAERPHAYLRTTVVNRCRNWQRHERVKRSKLPLMAAPAAQDFVAEELADAVAALPFRQRAVIVLRYYVGLSELEIAEALGCRPGTVKSLCSRALRQLKKEIS
jgi:RNA polymerase sigma-70 factor (sigma-E family)